MQVVSDHLLWTSQYEDGPVDIPVRWEDWSLERVSHVPNIIQMEAGEARIEVRLFTPQPACLPATRMMLFHILGVGPCQDGWWFQENQYKMHHAGPATELDSATGPSPLPHSRTPPLPPGQPWGFWHFSPNGERIQLLLLGGKWFALCL